MGLIHVHSWPSDPSIAHFVVSDSSSAVDSFEIVSQIDAARTAQARAIRTGALYPAMASVFASLGFVAIDTLALLRVDLDADTLKQQRRRATAAARRHGGTVRRLPARRFAEAASVDRRAFGDEWANSAESLLRIRSATPHHRAHQIVHDRRTVGFAISGLGRGHGYLQRLAVDPTMQRRGYGRALVADSMRWMQARGATEAVVNTGVTNTAALTLYQAAGFRRTDVLQVMELTLER